MEEQNKNKFSESYYLYIQKFYSINRSIIFTEDNIDKTIFEVYLKKNKGKLQRTAKNS